MEVLLLITAGMVLGLLKAGSVYGHRSERQEQAASAKARHDQGRAAEVPAKALLIARGYKVVDEKKSLTVPVLVDGKQDKPLTVQPDFVVTKGGKRYIADSKTGEVSNPRHKDTRRQLLEYYVTDRPDGLLVVDGLKGTIQTLEFPAAKSTPPASRRSEFILLTLSVALLASNVSADDWCQSYIALVQKREEQSPPSTTGILTAIDYQIRRRCGY